jgi:integrase
MEQQYDYEPYSPKPKPETPWVAPKMKIGVYKRKSGRREVYFSFEGKQVHLQKLPWGKPLRSDLDTALLIGYLRRFGYHPEKWGKDASFQFNKVMDTWIKNSNVSPEWLRQRKLFAKRKFIPYFKSRDIRTIQSVHIMEFYTFLKSKGFSSHYLSSLMKELHAFLNFNKKSLKEFPDFPKITVQEPAIKWLTSKEQDRVFQHIPKQDLPIFEFMRRYGCRINEASGLLKANVHLENSPSYVVLATVLGAMGQLKPTTKTGRIKVLPVIPELKWLFEGANDSEFVFAKKFKGGWIPYSNKMLNTLWNRANRVSGVTTINLYNAMRHSFGCQRLNQGFSRDEIKTVMGHTSTKTTERYASYQLQTLESIIRGNDRPTIASPDIKLLDFKGENEGGSKTLSLEL